MALAELVWLHSLLKELGHNYSSTVLWCVNLGATFLASNPAFHACTKHVELDNHFVREKVADINIHVHFICSQDQLVDALTKPLSYVRFIHIRSKLTITSVSMSLRGPVSNTEATTSYSTQIDT
jgi:hypothetical protein